MTTALAFYKGKGNWQDLIIRLVTRSIYSHVEYIQDMDVSAVEGHSVCWSSSPRDGGVRSKMINLADGKWDVVELPWHYDHMGVFFSCMNGMKYDWFGIFFCQFFNFRRQDRNKWFCSEICGEALGIKQPERHSPDSLKIEVEKLNQIFRHGRTPSCVDVDFSR